MAAFASKPNPLKIMKTIILFRVGVFALLLAASSAFAGDLEMLAGKWSVKKTNDQGQSYTQTIEIKKNKMTFTMAGADGQVRLFATGDIKLEKLGPFSVMKITNLEAGQSASDLKSVDDDRTLIYQISDDSWTAATNFDKEREEKPSLDVYKKVTK